MKRYIIPNIINPRLMGVQYSKAGSPPTYLPKLIFLHTLHTVDEGIVSNFVGLQMLIFNGMQPQL